MISPNQLIERQYSEFIFVDLKFDGKCCCRFSRSFPVQPQSRPDAIELFLQTCVPSHRASHFEIGHGKRSIPAPAYLSNGGFAPIPPAPAYLSNGGFAPTSNSIMAKFGLESRKSRVLKSEKSGSEVGKVGFFGILLTTSHIGCLDAVSIARSCEPKGIA
jgi:hypothetical protein